MCSNECSNHWICIIVDVKEGMAWVLDSIDKDEDTYKDFLAILQTYIYIYMNHPH